jgi:hypothetical protein
MRAYASRTGTRRNLALLKAAGWRLMISAKGVQRNEGFRYALDNGAWHAFCRKLPFDGKAFMASYYRFGKDADFVVLPDIVAGGELSLAFSMSWRAQIPKLCHQLLAVQDGMSPEKIGPLLNAELGIFLGGTDSFKEATMEAWGRLARERGAYFHVGRVNTKRRIFLCAAAGADSFDGSSASRFAANVTLLNSARMQPDLFVR